MFTLIDRKTTIPPITVHNIFSGLLSEDEIIHRSQAAGLYTTDCLSDENPHYTISDDPDGQPIWQLHQLINGKFIQTYFDADELPEAGTPERLEFLKRIGRCSFEISGTPEKQEIDA